MQIAPLKTLSHLVRLYSAFVLVLSFLHFFSLYVCVGECACVCLLVSVSVSEALCPYMWVIYVKQGWEGGFKGMFLIFYVKHFELHSFV